MRKAAIVIAAIAAAAAGEFLLAPITASAQAAVTPIHVSPTMRSADLAALPDTQMVVFPNGLRMSVRQLRGLSPLQRLPGRSSEMLRKPPGGPVLQVTPESSLAQLERAAPQTLLQLPDGRRITAAQLKAVDEALAKSRPTTARARPAAGQAIRVPHGTPLAELLARPDGDVLESPGGKRITVGELRRYLSGAAAGPARQGTLK